MTVVLTQNNFEQEVKQGVSLVDFWAEWCGPCQTMLPILDDLSQKMKAKAKIAKVNVDENPELASKFRVMSIPTMIVMKDWELVEQLVWVQQADSLVEVLEKYL